MEFSLFPPLEALQAAEFQIARQRRLDSPPNPVFFECVSMFLQWFPSKHGTLHFCRHKTGRKHHVRQCRVSAERVLVNVPAPMLRSGACTSPHVLLYSVGSVLLDGARLPQPYAPTFRCSTPLHSCQLLKSCTPMLRSSLESAPLHSAAALPLRCSAPLRSPPLRCANLCSDAPLHLVRQLFRSDAPLLRCSMHFAPLRNSPLRCSDAPLRNPLRL